MKKGDKCREKFIFLLIFRLLFCHLFDVYMWLDDLYCEEQYEQFVHHKSDIFLLFTYCWQSVNFFLLSTFFQTNSHFSFLLPAISYYLPLENKIKYIHCSVPVYQYTNFAWQLSHRAQHQNSF